jgi:hypothetical protein
MISMENSLLNNIYSIVNEIYPHKQISDIIDKDIWFKHIYKVIFTDNSAVYFKLRVNSESDICMESNAALLLNKNGIRQPEIIKVDTTCSLIPYEYGIYEDVRGVPLANYLQDSNENLLSDIYTAVGRYFRRFAEISGTFAGVWDTVPDRPKYPIHPADAMFELEIAGGSGKALLDKGMISQKTYDDILNIWKAYIPKIKALPVQLTHFSPFPWNIYLDKNETGSFVSKITCLSDILWWNEHATIAHILYPPFFDISDDLRQAFMYGYNRHIDFDIVNCFLLLYRLCAINNTYMQPEFYNLNEWKASALKEIDDIIRNIDN